jgi:hypothetical protein
MQCYRCHAEIVPHPNYADGVRVWHEKGSEPPRVHQCPPQAKIIQDGKWRGFTHKEAADISINQDRIHRAYLAKLRAMFVSPYAKETDVL